MLIGDELAENGAIRRTRSRWGNLAIRAEKPKLAYAPHGTTLDHSNVSGQTRELCLSILFTLRAEALKACLRSRDCELARSPIISHDLTTNMRDYFEIGGRLREIQSRTLMQALSAPARRVNNIDRHSAWVCPETLEWSRVVLSGTLARNGETQQNN